MMTLTYTALVKSQHIPDAVSLAQALMPRYTVYGDAYSMLAVEEPQPDASTRPMVWQGYATDCKAALAAAKGKAWS